MKLNSKFILFVLALSTIAQSAHALCYHYHGKLYCFPHNKEAAAETISLNSSESLDSEDGYYGCDVGSREPVKYYSGTYIVDEQVVYSYGTIYSDHPLSYSEIQQSKLCKKYTKLGQTCQSLNCFPGGSSSDCPKGTSYRCRPAHNLAGEICGCYKNG